MTEDSSGKGSGLFGKKGIAPKDVKLCILNKFDREIFFQQLKAYGWEELESAFTFDFDWTEKKIRKAATEHAAEIQGDLLIEVKDGDYARNPYNDYVYYIWRSGPNTRGLPPPPNISQRAAQQQMIRQQQLAIMQQQQRLQAQMMQMQAAAAQTQQMPQPAGVPAGQFCPKCRGNQIQFMANGMGKCITCGFTFQWQGQQLQMQPAPQPAPPMQQPGQPPQPQQQAPKPVQMPPTPTTVQPGAPTPPGAQLCPKCGGMLNVFPDGSSLCNKCGYTGK